ncbi:GAP family protein [Kribbella shirazensis]|uniref:Threonine/homoserine/homoserine lactone efflux protein n=1 Tax=Kribbella shirazensis TaxID=1105143 RepID=A0A7X5VDI3_9ACTN|nr:GAP family protein [Kribbella shirazensis]NIK59245.1 threonine/homoserine/homoserine lactone efflux protein [Kribbella shirazensis]
MGDVIGEILPLALVVAISPIPIIAAILMLLSPNAKTTGVGFLVGWIAGVVIAVVAFTLLSSLLSEDDSDTSNPVKGTIQLALGVLLILLAAKQWQARPRGQGEPELPKWMSAIDTLTTVKGLGLGFLLSALNPKNLIMAAGAGIAIGGGNLGTGETVVVIIVFTAIAASTVAVPVIGYLAAADRLAEPLEALRGWLVRENTVVMAILLLVIGVVMIGKGIGSF